MPRDHVADRLREDVESKQDLELPTPFPDEDAADLVDPRPEPSGELMEEDDDNAYGESDDALPDDEEEEVIEHNPEREERRFDDL